MTSSSNQTIQDRTEVCLDHGLPSGWAEACVGDIANMIRGVTYDKTAASDQAREGSIPILRATNIQDERLVLNRDLVHVPQRYVVRDQILQRGDIIICTSSGSKQLVGKAAQFVDDRTVSFGAFCAAVRSSKSLSRAYVGYFFQSPSYRDTIRLKSSGVNINNLRRGDVEELVVPLAPYAEQHRIVAEIEKQFSRLDAAVAALKRAQVNLRRYRASVLKAACEGRLVPQDPNDEPASELLKRILAGQMQMLGETASAPKRAPARVTMDGITAQGFESPAPLFGDYALELPTGWCWTTVAHLGQTDEQTVLTGPFGSNLGRDDFLASGVPVLTIGCLTARGITLEKAFYVADGKAAELDRYRVKSGDLLFSRMASVGRADIVPDRLSGAVINYHLMRLRLSDMVVNPKYFITYVRGSRMVVDYIREVNHGATRDGINTAQLMALPVALPPLAEQHGIVSEVERRLSVVAELETAVAANLKRAERLRQAILKRAFEGRLVPQDPNDEPASVLLERIRAQRESSHGEAKLVRPGLRSARSVARPR